MMQPIRTLALLAPLLGLALACSSGSSTVRTDPQATEAPRATTAEAASPESVPSETPVPTEKSMTSESLATFGAGCFWCVEAVLEQYDGVLDVSSGYMGGETENPTYKEVCTGRTGHAEVVQVRFDPARISYDELLGLFFKLHDPTTLNRQGADVGTQYRSVVFFHTPEQETAARAAIERYGPDFDDPIVTEVSAASTYYEAEDYHQDYYPLNRSQPYCRAVIAPKLDKLGLDK